MLSDKQLQLAVFEEAELTTPTVCIPINETNKPTTKELRLALDIVDHAYPLWKKANRITKAQLVLDLFKYDIPIERITNIKSFKQILFKKVISNVRKYNNVNIVKTIKVRRT